MAEDKKDLINIHRRKIQACHDAIQNEITGTNPEADAERQS